MNTSITFNNRPNISHVSTSVWLYEFMSRAVQFCAAYLWVAHKICFVTYFHTLIKENGSLACDVSSLITLMQDFVHHKGLTIPKLISDTYVSWCLLLFLLSLKSDLNFLQNMILITTQIYYSDSEFMCQ